MIPSNTHKECLEAPMDQRYNHTMVKKQQAVMMDKRTNPKPIPTVLVHVKNKTAPDWAGNGGINTGIISLEEVI